MCRTLIGTVRRPLFLKILCSCHIEFLCGTLVVSVSYKLCAASREPTAVHFQSSRKDSQVLPYGRSFTRSAAFEERLVFENLSSVW